MEGAPVVSSLAVAENPALASVARPKTEQGFEQTTAL
jgi:hypothetical protein